MLATYAFFFLAFIAIFFALLVVFSKNPIHSCLYLVLTMFAIAGNYVLLNAQFLAVVQLIVYAGAIMVLFLFTIMLLNLSSENEPVKSNLIKFIATIGGGSLLLVFVLALKKTDLGPAPLMFPNPNQQGMIQNLGKVLFSEYVFPFEVISILILISLMGAVVLGRKDKKVNPINE
ncbi:MAG: NADH-quinone oxidoreductase subunit J [Chitinophagales bacterium]|jgi:NADH-quinone oxidoreductase subunit J|nr:NADH-quinone oxidoreductase subunit J [Chitinophagales bacterium]